MEYVDDGASESEVLGPVQESHQILQDTTSQSDQPADPPPLHHSRGSYYTTMTVYMYILTSYDGFVIVAIIIIFNLI